MEMGCLSLKEEGHTLKIGSFARYNAMWEVSEGLKIEEKRKEIPC